MSSFAGVSVLDDGMLCPSTMTFVSTSSDCGYHLLVVKGYARTKETPNGQSILSHDFGVGGYRWSIKYYPNGIISDRADVVSLYVHRLDDDDGKHVEAKFSFSFVDEVEWQNPVYIRGMKTCSFSSDASSWGFYKFMKIDALERLMNLDKDDCFTIRCDIMVCNAENDAGGTQVLLPDIHRNLNNLLHNKVGADVTFEVGSDIFSAHRCVLAAQSKVFMAQLFGPMKEGSASLDVIQIKDMEATTFKALLSFIYTDSFPDMKEDEMSQATEEEAVKYEMWRQWLQNLLVAADRYDVQRLKYICEKELCKNMCVSSVASMLVLAEQHHCHRLKEACLKFIQVQSPSCLQTIIASKGWQHIIATYPSVLNELIAKVIASNQQLVLK
ncbi:hypothetical protein CFC21_090601 [Triticum aestivum]|uniref:BTB domain-containing protein n=2 Tax=Triticum aestivum TaxID=4565 RepID=A0A3B6PW13_WHEAT|nr:BTB/POZ and MATH domain-containing protein 3-like [Triticum aestivum]KAF7087409.1 hypothetical protein CFC21_090601 [Triticum aestivum]